MRFKTQFYPAAISGLLLFIVAPMSYHAYQSSIKPSLSPFQLAAKQLGLASSQQQALVKTLNYSGYFKEEKLWHDAVMFAKITAVDPKKIYYSVTNTLKNSLLKGLDEPDFKLVAENLLKNTDLTEEDALAWIVFISQNAFGRAVGEERNVLLADDNLMDKKHQEHLLQALDELGFINEISLKSTQYAEAWIMGAASSRLEKRIEYYKSLRIIVEEIKLLAGERLLSPEIDEKNLMIQLAKDNDIAFNQQQPFIQKQGKLSFNYQDQNGKKLTETLMAEYLNNKLLDGKATIIDTKSENNQRPTTESTARDAAKMLMEKISKGEYAEQENISIAVVSNQPYVQRQTQIVQKAIEKFLKDNGLDSKGGKGYKISIEGCGSKVDTSNKNFLKLVLSESSSWIVERAKDVFDPKYKEILEKLLYQNREDPGPMPLMPLPISEDLEKGINLEEAIILMGE